MLKEINKKEFLKKNELKEEKIACIYCRGKNLIKRGRQKTKYGEKQVYFCKSCNKRFILSLLKGKSFNAKIILNALSYYNIGNTLEQSSKLINRKFKIKISKSAIHKWLGEFKEIYPYHRLRNNISKEYGRDIIASKLFKHKGLTYNYKYHKAKIDLFSRNYKSLIYYLKSLEQNFPHNIFESDSRCSQIKVNIEILRKDKNNYACKLANFSLSSVSSNTERHELVESFMLMNDTATIAVEVPVWFWEKNINAYEGGIGICGHIDILQLKFGKIYILDFKPEADKENEQKVSSQLYLYARGLSFRARIPLERFRCAWFDADNYFEFEPSKVRIKWL